MSLALQPDLPEAYYELALLLREGGQTDKAAEAMAHLKKFRDAEPGESAAMPRQLQDTVR